MELAPGWPRQARPLLDPASALKGSGGLARSNASAWTRRPSEGGLSAPHLELVLGMRSDGSPPQVICPPRAMASRPA
jgi:hypothetical protein